MATLTAPRPGVADAGIEARRVVTARVRLDTVFTLVFALFGWAIGTGPLSDNSFLWHLRAGELILDVGIPHTDPFSYTAQGTGWVAQSWLAELAYAAAERLAGPFAIRAFAGVVTAAVVVLAFRLALRLTRDVVRTSLLSVAALGGFYALWSERPLLLGVLLFVVLLWVVEVPDSRVGRRPLLVLPILFWLWANVHGSFALGFVYLGLHLLGRWLDGTPPWEGRERVLALGGLIGFVVLFANPYGIGLVTFPIELLSRGDVLRDVVEWSSPDFHALSGQMLALWIVVFVLVVARARERVSRRDLLVAVPFLVLALWATRNVAVAPLVTLPIAARVIRVDDPSRRERSPVPFGPVVVGVLVALLAVVGVRAASEPSFDLRGYPVRAMRAVEDEGLIGRRLLTDEADSAYVLLERWPRQRVFFDDRFDMYPKDVIADFITVSNVDPGWRKVLEERDVEVIVWDRRRALAQALLLAEGWDVLHRDARYVVFVRSELAVSS